MPNAVETHRFGLIIIVKESHETLELVFLLGKGVRVHPFANRSAMYNGSQQATNAYN